MVENTVETYEILGGYKHLRLPHLKFWTGTSPAISPKSPPQPVVTVKLIDTTVNNTETIVGV
jgi:hypothetical protein